MARINYIYLKGKKYETWKSGRKRNPPNGRKSTPPGNRRQIRRRMNNGLGRTGRPTCCKCWSTKFGPVVKGIWRVPIRTIWTIIRPSLVHWLLVLWQDLAVQWRNEQKRPNCDSRWRMEVCNWIILHKLLYNRFCRCPQTPIRKRRPNYGL